MSQHLDTLMPAQIPDPNPTPLIGSTNHRGEVKAMAIFERQPRARAASDARRVRAWDELSEIDRAVLLETVRLRRKANERRRKLHQQHYGMRDHR